MTTRGREEIVNYVVRQLRILERGLYLEAGAEDRLTRASENRFLRWAQ